MPDIGYRDGEGKSMVKNILFDLDDTLFDFQTAERIALSKTLTDLGIEPEEAILQRYSVLNQAQWKRLEQGELTLEQVKTTRYQLLFEELGVDCCPKDATARYEKYLGMGHYYIEGAPELLETLWGRYRMYLVSNGTPAVQRSRLKSAGIGRYFEEIFISQEIGHKKPDRSFFEYCFAHAPKMRPEESVIVGDSLTSDILGGKNAGIKTVWFHPGETQVNAVKTGSDIIPDYTIRSLDELPELLVRMCR